MVYLLPLLLTVCGHAILNGGAPVPSEDCNMVCNGNPNELCGGPNRLNVYNYTGSALPDTISPPDDGNGGDDGGGPPPNPGATPQPGANLTEPWTYGGCWVYVPLTHILLAFAHGLYFRDNAHGRITPVGKGGRADQTIEGCIALCSQDGYNLAGIEYASS